MGILHTRNGVHSMLLHEGLGNEIFDKLALGRCLPG